MEREEKYQNLEYINTIKTIQITAVVWAHLTIPFYQKQLINSYSMPLFFALSGFLFAHTESEKTISRFLKHKIKTLLFPYLFFAILSYVFYLISPKSDGVNELKYVWGIFYAAASKEYLGFNIPLWFLPCLFISEVLFFLIRKFWKKFTGGIICVLFLMGIICKEYSAFRLPWGLDVMLFCMPFVYLGYMIRKKNIAERYFLNCSGFTKSMITLVAFMFTCLFSYYNISGGYLSVYTLHFNNYIIFALSSISGILLSFGLGVILPSGTVFNFYGRNTIIILGLHLPVFAVLKGVQVYILQIPLYLLEDSVFYNLIYLVATMGVFIPVIYVINTYAPFLIGRKKSVLQ